MTTTSPGSSTLRRLVVSYGTYGEAQQAVDTLSDQGFPVEHITIVGSGLRTVERVTGRLTVLRAAGLGAVTGAWIGLLIGLIFWIVSPWALGAVLSGVLIGIAFGAFWGAVLHALTGGRRDFASVRGLEAGRYDVLADEPHAETAMRILGQFPMPATEGPSTARHADRTGA
jgi:hypothetical protein